MQLSRKSKRQAGKDVNKEVVTKRPARAAAPNHQSLAGFEKKLEATIQAKPVGKRKPRRQSKGPARLDTPCLIAEPQDQTLFVGNGGVPRSSPSTNAMSTPPPNLPRNTRKHLPFDATQYQIAHVQRVTILLEWFIDNKRENTVLVSQDINNAFRETSTWFELKLLVLAEVSY
jgi:hypothetical protein